MSAVIFDSTEVLRLDGNGWSGVVALALFEANGGYRC
jgi:hypothetical protein